MIIGIDGATFDIIEPLIKNGELPTLRALTERGSYGLLQSQFPPYTWVAIASFLTGMNPGKHGIFDFTVNNHSNYEAKSLANSFSIKAPAFWDILPGYDKKTIFFFLPLSYPPREVKGVMVSKVKPEIMEKSSFTFPSSLKEEMIRELGVIDFEQLPFNAAAKREFTSRDHRFFGRKLKQLNYKFDMERQAVRYLISRFPWDVCILYFNNTDLLQHWYWKFMDEGHHFYNPGNGFCDAIYDGYRKVDTFIGEILSTLDEDTTVFIFSDHGFGPLYYKFYLNRWLMDRGLLFLKKDSNKKLQFKFVDIKKVLNRMGLRGMAEGLTGLFSKAFIPVLRWVNLPLKDVVDWTRTKAYGTMMGININLGGRESYGIVKRNEYDGLIRYIKSELKRLTDSRGKEVIDKVFQKEEVYHGSFMEYGTDLLFTFEKSFPCQITLEPFSREIFARTDKEELLSGTHFSTSQGILLTKGPCIKPNNPVYDANIMDILPTTLYLLGLPIHAGVDGKVLTEVIDGDYLKENPIRCSEDVHITGYIE
jgi:predicted AlkP superfamily phosphohydrolase/phosphomutase